MTSADALQRLAGLSKQDRDWIVRNLSAVAQQRLREQTATERANLEGPAARNRQDAPSGAARPSAEEDSGMADERALEWLSGEQVAEALSGEPPWIMATLLALRTWTWEPQMLARIAPVTRLEVSQLRLSAPRPSQAMSRLLLKSLRERVLGGGLSSGVSLP